MAKKNWKKIRDDRTGVDFYVVTSEENMSGKDVALRAYGEGKKSKWLVAVGDWGNFLKIIKRVKTKAQAVAFAKEYMKKDKSKLKKVM